MRSNVALGLFVIAILAMLFVPLPTPLLDLLLAVNLGVSVILLLVGLYLPHATALLAFPALLLLSTLFRLSLNVASTRLILTEGDAGTVIDAFGRLLVRGDVAVGLVIFAIITVVNFIVIAKGAGRVSEVAARFALDALPGKQMAIDADLRAGLLTPQEAYERREELRKESQLFGAMDGAMRFVQGDAIAGLLITGINIVGGMYVGLMAGMEVGEALDTYTILTVGDGLVTQIPALIISLCAGIVVTRVSSGGSATLAHDLLSQVFGRPVIIAGGAALMLVMALFPGLPFLPFFVVALALLGVAGVVYYGEQRGVSGSDDGTSRLLLPAPGGGLDDGFLQGDALDLELEASTLYRSFRARSQQVRDVWRSLQNECRESIGIVLPDLRPRSSSRLAAGRFSASLRGSVLVRGYVPPDAIALAMNEEHAVALGFEVREVLSSPFPIVWVAVSPRVKRMIDDGMVVAFDEWEWIAIRVVAALRNLPHEALPLAEVHRFLRALEKEHPGFVGEALPRVTGDVPRLAEIFQELVRAGLSVARPRLLVEMLAGYLAQRGIALTDADTPDVIDFLRRPLSPARMLAYSDDPLQVVVIGRQLERALMEGARVSDLSVISGVSEVVQRASRWVPPVVVLARREVISQLSLLLDQAGVRLTILSDQDVPSDVRLELLGTLELNTLEEESGRESPGVQQVGGV